MFEAVTGAADKGREDYIKFRDRKRKDKRLQGIAWCRDWGTLYSKLAWKFKTSQNQDMHPSRVGASTLHKGITHATG